MPCTLISISCFIHNSFPLIHIDLQTSHSHVSVIILRFETPVSYRIPHHLLLVQGHRFHMLHPPRWSFDNLLWPFPTNSHPFSHNLSTKTLTFAYSHNPI
ncbi:hypothetical protein TorRG33x02_194620, partial [Trema orientale]